MQARFVQRDGVIDYIPETDVAAGDIVVLGDLVTIAKLDIKAGELGALATEGMFEIPKGEGVPVPFAQGAVVYWDAAGKKVLSTAAGGAVRLGPCAAASGNELDHVRFLLNG